jgi:excisionase family DNA binding protein
MKAEMATSDMPPLCVTVEETCRLLGVSRSTVWALIGSGKIKVARIGRRTLPLYRSLEALVAPDPSESAPGAHIAAPIS